MCWITTIVIYVIVIILIFSFMIELQPAHSDESIIIVITTFHLNLLFIILSIHNIAYYFFLVLHHVNLPSTSIIYCSHICCIIFKRLLHIFWFCRNFSHPFCWYHMNQYSSIFCCSPPLLPFQISMIFTKYH